MRGEGTLGFAVCLVEGIVSDLFDLFEQLLQGHWLETVLELVGAGCGFAGDGFFGVGGLLLQLCGLAGWFGLSAREGVCSAVIVEREGGDGEEWYPFVVVIGGVGWVFWGVFSFFEHKAVNYKTDTH